MFSFLGGQENSPFLGKQPKAIVTFLPPSTGVSFQEIKKSEGKCQPKGMGNDFSLRLFISLPKKFSPKHKVSGKKMEAWSEDTEVFEAEIKLTQ